MGCVRDRLQAILRGFILRVGEMGMWADTGGKKARGVFRGSEVRALVSCVPCVRQRAGRASLEPDFASRSTSTGRKSNAQKY